MKVFKSVVSNVQDFGNVVAKNAKKAGRKINNTRIKAKIEIMTLASPNRAAELVKKANSSKVKAMRKAGEISGKPTVVEYEEIRFFGPSDIREARPADVKEKKGLKARKDAMDQSVGIVNEEVNRISDIVESGMDGPVSVVIDSGIARLVNEFGRVGAELTEGECRNLDEELGQSFQDFHTAADMARKAGSLTEYQKAVKNLSEALLDAWMQEI